MGSLRKESQYDIVAITGQRGSSWPLVYLRPLNLSRIKVAYCLRGYTLSMS